MGYVLGTLGVAAVTFVCGVAIGLRAADLDYEPVEWGGEQPTLYVKHSDDEAYVRVVPDFWTPLTRGRTVSDYCPRCDLFGFHFPGCPDSTASEPPMIRAASICPTCDGDGTSRGRTCDGCSGTGRVTP